MKYILFLFSIFSFSQTQKFIPIDEETLEYIGEVNYTLFFHNKAVYNNVSSRDNVTFLPNNVIFDSISFAKVNYKEKGLKKEQSMPIIKKPIKL